MSPQCCFQGCHHSQQACTPHQRRSVDPRRRKKFHPQPRQKAHVAKWRISHNNGNLFSVAIIEPFSFWHAIELALSRCFQIRNPIVVLSFKQLLVELCTLLLPVFFKCYHSNWTSSLIIFFLIPDVSHLKSLAPLGQGCGLQVANLFPAPTQELGRGLLQLRTHVSTPPPQVLDIKALMRKRRFRAKTLSKVTEVPIHPSPRIPLHRWIKKVLLPVQQPSFIPPIIFVGDLPCLAFRSKQLSVVFDLGREFFNGWSFQVGLTWWCPLSRGRSVKSSSYSSRLSSCRALNTCYMLFIGCNKLMKVILIAIMVKWLQWKCFWRPLAEELHGIQEVRGGGGSFWQKPASSPHPSKLPANNHQPPICLFFLYPSRYNNFHDCIYRDKCQRNHDA